MYMPWRHKHTHTHHTISGAGASRRIISGLANGSGRPRGECLRVLDRILPALGGWLSEGGGGLASLGLAARTHCLGRGGGGAAAAGSPFRASQC